MEYYRTITLKDGRTCVLRNAAEQDAEAVLSNFILTHGQTDYLTSYPDEISFSEEQERDYLKKNRESRCEVEIVAVIGGRIAGTAGVRRVGTAEKVRHRASFGISIDRDWWGLGIGRGLTQSCIECAGKMGYLQLELEVSAKNDRALALYRSEGGHWTAERRPESGERITLGIPARRGTAAPVGYI